MSKLVYIYCADVMTIQKNAHLCWSTCEWVL